MSTNATDGDLEPAGYGELLETLKQRVRTTQVRAARAGNTELLRLYWSIGRDILERQDNAGWGGKVIDRLADDLRGEFPEQRGWSRSNLHYMRAFAAAWPSELEVVPQAVGQLPWGHVRLLLDRLEDPAERDWYAANAVRYGWSRNVLHHQIATGLHRREGEAVSNFENRLPPTDSDLAQQLTRDPYVFEHLALTKPAAEHEVEQSLMDRLQETLTEFGHGMAFVGRAGPLPRRRHGVGPRPTPVRGRTVPLRRRRAEDRSLLACLHRPASVPSRKFAAVVPAHARTSLRCRSRK